MKTKFNKKGEAVITINENEAIIMHHILKKFIDNAERDEWSNWYFVTEGIASCFTISEFNTMRDMLDEVDGAVRQILRG
jgi:hypothetical protein